MRVADALYDKIVSEASVTEFKAGYGIFLAFKLESDFCQTLGEQSTCILYPFLQA